MLYTVVDIFDNRIKGIDLTFSLPSKMSHLLPLVLLLTVVFEIVNCQEAEFINLKTRNSAARRHRQARREGPSVGDRVEHKDHEIPEEDIINLPIGRFPEPYCEYSVHWNDHKGPKVDRFVLKCLHI